MRSSGILCHFVLVISLVASAPTESIEGKSDTVNITEGTTPKEGDVSASGVDFAEFDLPDLFFLKHPLMRILRKNFLFQNKSQSSGFDLGDTLTESHKVSSTIMGQLNKGEEPFHISSISAKKQTVHVSKNGSVDSETSSIHLIVKGDEVYEVDYPDSLTEDDMPQDFSEGDEEDYLPNDKNESPLNNGKTPLPALANEVDDYEGKRTTDGGEDLVSETVSSPEPTSEDTVDN